MLSFKYLKGLKKTGFSKIQKYFSNCQNKKKKELRKHCSLDLLVSDH